MKWKKRKENQKWWSFPVVVVQRPVSFNLKFLYKQDVTTLSNILAVVLFDPFCR